MRNVLRLFFPVLLVATLAACSTGTEVMAPSDPVAAPVEASPQSTGLELADRFPIDPRVRVDTLENGLRYYIRANREPENRAELRLAFDAGSILETDEQRGLAHFVEHMLFNGTCRFPEQALVDFFETIGMRFGPDLNAYTSFDETVYMLTIPTDDPAIEEQAFDVLADWATCALLTEEEIDKERGVVVEELRARNETAQGRIQEQLLDVLLHGSLYAVRDPGGEPDIIRTADYDTIRRYYDDWYRPDLMAVVAVGDFDPDRIEQLIRERFASIDLRPDAPERGSFQAPDYETLYQVMSDPELTYTNVTVYYSKTADPDDKIEDYRKDLVAGLFNGMLNQRFEEIARTPDAPFLGAGVFRGSLVRPAEYYGLGAAVHEDSIRTGLEAIVTEAARVRLHGFTETELDRQKRDLLRRYQRAYNERNKTRSDAYAREYVANFLETEPIPGIEFELEVVKRYLPAISLAEVNRLADELLDERNRAVFVQMPEKEGLVPPSDADLESTIRSVEQKEIAPYVDTVTDQPLVEAVPSPAPIVSEREIAELDVQEIVLENGVRVVMKATDFKDDEVRFAAVSPGGASLVEVEDHFEAQNASTIVSMSGLGAFDRNALDKLLAGKVVNVAPSIADAQEGLSGTASPEDLETLFQLIHLYMTAPRADRAAFEAFQNQYRAYLMNRSANPTAAFQDTLRIALFGDHPRNFVPTMEMVDELDLERAHEIFRERFEDAGDFTFVFVGSFDPENLRSLAQTYLGTLPSAPGEESWQDVLPRLKSGVSQKTLHRGMGDRSQVSLVFTGELDYNRETRHELRSLDEILSIVLREELREERGGVYGVSVSSSPRDIPEEAYTFTISFGCDPERVDELVEAVWTEINRLKEEGARESDIAKVKEQQRRARETDLRTNPFWVNVLEFYYSHEDEDILDINRYLEMTENLTDAQIGRAAQRYLGEDSFVKVVLYPENYSAVGAAAPEGQ